MKDLNSVIFGFELDVEEVIHNSDNSTLSTGIVIMSIIGMGLSSLALLLLILTAILFAEWRNSYKNQLLIQFMIARYLYTLTRHLFEIQITVHMIRQKITVVASLLIYTEATLICWMFIFSRQMYISLVKVFDTQHASIWKVSLLTWISPGFVLLFFLILYFIIRENNGLLFSALIITIKWPILILNAVLLISVLKSVLTNRRNARSNVKIIVVMVVMIFVFGFQHMFKDIFMLMYLLAGEVDVAALTLTMSNLVTLYQCAFSITFWLFGNENTRKLWRFQKKESASHPELVVKFSA